MLLDNLPYVLAFLMTASIHMEWSAIPELIHHQFQLLVNTSSSAAGSIIKLHGFALLMLMCSLSIKTTSSSAIVATHAFTETHNFDDLKTRNGLGSIRSDGPLTFTGFSVIEPNNPKLSYILPWDRNCATSLPNALLGSRSCPADDRPTISINATAAKISGLEARFHLHGISIKPLALTPDLAPFSAKVTIRGGSGATGPADDHPSRFQVDWPAGYNKPLLVDMDNKQFSSESWSGLQWLDFEVDFGPDRLDWEFCVDDLVVGFIEKNEEILCSEGVLCIQDK